MSNEVPFFEKIRRPSFLIGSKHDYIFYWLCSFYVYTLHGSLSLCLNPFFVVVLRFSKLSSVRSVRLLTLTVRLLMSICIPSIPLFWSSASVWFCGCSARCRGCKLTTEPQRPKERLCEQSSLRSILYSKPFRIIKEKIKYNFVSEHECIAVDKYEIFL